MTTDARSSVMSSHPAGSARIAAKNPVLPPHSALALLEAYLLEELPALYDHHCGRYLMAKTAGTESEPDPLLRTLMGLMVDRWQIISGLRESVHGIPQGSQDAVEFKGGTSGQPQ